MAFFLISSMVLGLFDQLQIFSVVSDRILGLLTGLGLLELSGHIKLNHTNIALLLQELTQKYLCPSLLPMACASFAFLAAKVFFSFLNVTSDHW